jgi:preprotein translocase subunit SecD
MRDRASRWLILIVAIALLAAWMVWPENPGIHALGVDRSLDLRLGLDLQGGLEVLLEADTTGPITSDAMGVAREIINRRINALGVAEPLIQVVGNNRLSVNLPGIQDPETAIASIRQTGLLEFVDPGGSFLTEDQVIQTDCVVPQPGGTCLTAAEAGISATPTVTATQGLTATTPITPTGPVYHTVMTGAILASAAPALDELGQWQIEFTLTGPGSQLFSDYTSAHLGENLAIVLDKRVLSAPEIRSAITGGQGVIQGSFTGEEARRLADLLKYGALPVPLKIIKNSTIGPTLGEDSVRQSVVAGIVGLLAVATFMIAYYRLPGVLAVIALLIYAMITIALFKLIPVTLTLPGIFGFILSIGVAVDANVLIFERLKEELRSGKRVEAAVDAGFARAWPSIRDSNISTLITCAILFWFGSNFGASVVQGFAVTLALGIFVSLFTAIIVTRTFLHLVLDRMDFEARHAWLGV